MPRKRTLAPLVAALWLGAAASACTSLRMPARAPSFPETELRRTSEAGLVLGARPVEGRELNLDLFDDDLPEVGLAAVWVVLENRSEAPVDLGGVRWSLALAGRRVPALDRDGILKRFYRARRIRMYTLQTDAAARAGLERSLLGAGRLEPGGTRSGFVFLKIDSGDAAVWTRGELAARGVRVAGRELDLALALTHAKP